MTFALWFVLVWAYLTIAWVIWFAVNIFDDAPLGWVDWGLIIFWPLGILSIFFYLFKLSVKGE